MKYLCSIGENVCSRAFCVLIAAVGSLVACTSQSHTSDIVFLYSKQRNHVQYLMVDGSTLRFTPRNPPVVLWSGESVVEACQFLKQRGQRRITWLDIAKKGFALPDQATQQATSRIFRQNGIRVKVSYLVVGPPIFDPGTPPAADPP
jgi:hypothetical protein